MSRLSIIDSIFLWVETPEIPAHIAGLQIFSLPKGKGTAWLQELMASLREHPPGYPFNQRLKSGSAARPELVEEKDFDFDYHLRHTVLPKPGNEEQLRNLVARLQTNLIDRDRPLWEFHLIEGLENRRFAFYIKIHHAICDGATFSKWMAQSTGTSPGANTPPVWARPRKRTGHAERPWLAALQAPAGWVRTGRDISLGIVQIMARILRARFIENNQDIALPLSGPHTAFNAELTASRNLAFCQYPVDELKAMGRPHGATLNDVVLAICDESLRRYLAEQGQFPEKPLVAAVPVNVRAAGEASEGNHVASLQVKLGREGKNPAERLQAITRSVNSTKGVFNGVPVAASQAYSFAAAGLAAAGQSLHLVGIMPPPMNLIISNVPGPRETRYFAGAKLEALYPVSGVAPMTALNVTVYSYAGTLFVGLISGRRALPHIHDLKLCMDEVYEEYRQALLVNAASPEPAH
jgi:diacylglycerol O-acyltransferase